MPAKQEPNIGINYGWNGGESGINLQLDENWRSIGALLQLSVVSKTDDVPGSPEPGDRYIVPSGASGDWSGLDRQVVRYNEDAWEIYTPLNGWLAYVADENLFYQFDGTIWKGAPFLTASNVSFNPDGTSLTSTDAQAAINELEASLSAGGVADGGIQTVKLADYSRRESTTTGLTFGHREGRMLVGSTTVSTDSGTVELTESTTNYVEVSKQGIVSTNTDGFTAGSIPLYIVVTDSSEIVTIDDRRTWLTVADTRPGVNNQTGTDYVLTASDENSIVRCSNADPVTVAVPAETGVNFPVGSIIQIRQVNDGQVTLSPDADVTLNTPETLKSRKQGSTIALTKVATDEWDITGDLEAAE